MAKMRYLEDQRRREVREAERAEKGLLPESVVQTLFIEWLCGDKEPDDTQEQFGSRHGVHPRKLSEWKKDPDFVRRWEARMRELHAHPEKQAELLDILFEKAKCGDAKDIETYFKLIDKMSPSRLEIDDKRKLEDLSDDELAEMAAELDNVEFLREA